MSAPRVHLTTGVESSGETVRGLLSDVDTLNIRALLNRGALSSATLLQFSAVPVKDAILFQLTSGGRTLGRWRFDGTVAIPDLDLEAAPR